MGEVVRLWPEKRGWIAGVLLLQYGAGHSGGDGGGGVAVGRRGQEADWLRGYLPGGGRGVELCGEWEAARGGAFQTDLYPTGGWGCRWGLGGGPGGALYLFRERA